MQISSSQRAGRVPVTVLQLDGNLDASNYTEAIKEGQRLFDGGARDLVLDLSRVPYMSSAGLMALHTVSLIFAGQNLEADGAGRPKFRSLNPSKDQAARQHLKLLNPQPAVDAVLDTVGLKSFFEVFSDLDAAVQSFG